MAPITTRSQLVVSGTEVFHRACAGAIEHSRSNRLTQQVLALERALEQAKRSAREAEQGCDRITSAFSGRLDALEVAMTATERDLARERRALTVARVERDTAVRMANSLRAERDSARAEAALHQRIGTPSTTPQVARTESTPDNADTRDDTEQRFAMLEFD